MNETADIFNMNETVAIFPPSVSRWNRTDIEDYILTVDFLNLPQSSKVSSWMHSSTFKHVRLLLCLIGFILNSAFLLVNLIHGRTKNSLMKIRFLVLWMTFINVLFFFIHLFVFAFDSIYDVSSVAAKMFNEMDDPDFEQRFWKIMIESVFQPFSDMVSFMLLYIALDRYASLFSVYWPYLKHRIYIIQFLIVPLIFCFIPINSLFLYYIAPYKVVITIRLIVTSFPQFLTFLLSVVALLAQQHNKHTQPTTGTSLISLTVPLITCILVLSIFDLIAHIFFLFRFLADNLDFVLLTGSEATDSIIHTFLDVGLEISICIVFLIPLFMPIIFATFVQNFRDPFTRRRVSPVKELNRF